MNEQERKAGIEAMSTDMLRAIYKLCPDGKDVRETEFSALGRSVKLTKASRDLIVAELKRRGKRP